MKTARERLAFRIAEKIAEEYSPDNFFTGCSLTPEEIMPTILAELPQSYEELESELEEFEKSISGEPKPIERPTLLDRLRASVHADKGTPLKVVLEAAIKACNERDKLLRLEAAMESILWQEHLDAANNNPGTPYRIFLGALKDKVDRLQSECDT